MKIIVGVRIEGGGLFATRTRAYAPSSLLLLLLLGPGAAGPPATPKNAAAAATTPSLARRAAAATCSRISSRAAPARRAGLGLGELDQVQNLQNLRFAYQLRPYHILVELKPLGQIGELIETVTPRGPAAALAAAELALRLLI